MEVGWEMDGVRWRKGIVDGESLLQVNLGVWCVADESHVLVTAVKERGQTESLVWV